MIQATQALPAVLEHSRANVVFAPGALSQLGALALEHGAGRVLLVTDPGIVAAGHADRALSSLRESRIDVTVFDRVQENPTTAHVDAGVKVAQTAKTDFLVGLGGGSAMDCAKGINFILTNGGTMADYIGVDKAAKPMLAMIAIPTTAGTGSEAQSFALICDAATHRKMACGDKKALARVAILDPDLTRTQPPRVAAATAIDAVAHAVETAATTKKNEMSLEFTSQAWLRLNRSFERAMREPQDDDARADMLLGAHLAGAAIEASMLGAAHACANPLTRRFEIVHGLAVGLLLPSVVRFNTETSNPYSAIDEDAGRLVARIEHLLDVAEIPTHLRDLGVDADSLPALAEEAASQWTAGFNPRPVTPADLLAIYRSAF